MSDTSYYFLSSARHGLASGIKNAAASQRATIDVTLSIKARNKSTGEFNSPEQAISQSVALYGPGDILGFDPRIIARHDPKSDVGNFEPNYFPAIEFTDPDFIWRYTADKANINGLMPWVTLIVLVSETRGDNIVPEFKEGPRHNRKLPRSIEVTASNALPDLQYAWRWAHVQTFDEQGKQNDELIEVLTDEPERAICRLVCPRRLMPQTRYDAFIVPTFMLGVHAGLGEEFPEGVNALTQAWAFGENNVRLPYYYRWQFRTGMRGDFEHLVRLLEPRQLTGLGLRDMDCASPGFGVTGVVRADVDEADAHILAAEGALQSICTEYTPWGKDSPLQPNNLPEDTQVDIADLISLSDIDRELNQIPSLLNETAEIHDININANTSGTSVSIVWQSENSISARLEYWLVDTSIKSVDADKQINQYEVTLEKLIPTRAYYFKIIVILNDNSEIETPQCAFEIPLPTVAPPIYGQWHYGRAKSATNTVIDPDDQEAWIDHLNLDPRHRVASGLGSQVIRKQQDPLMASAWDQLGAIESANDLLRRNQFARDSGNYLYKRFQSLHTEDYLRITNPVQKRVMIDNPQTGSRTTVAEYFKKQSRIPEAAFDPAMRRIMRPRGPIRRKRQAAGRNLDMLSKLAASSVDIIEAHVKPTGTSGLCEITQRLEDALPPISEPTLSLDADPGNVNPGETSTLTWASDNTTSCIAAGYWAGSRPTVGNEVVGPFGAGTGTIPGEVTIPGGGLAGYTVEAWAALNRTGSTRRIPRTQMVKLASTSIFSSGTFVINLDEKDLGRLRSEVYFKIYTQAGHLIENTQNTLNWDPANPAAVSINLGSGDVVDQGPGPVPDPGVPFPFPFSLTCTGPGGDVTAMTTVFLSSGVDDDGGTDNPAVTVTTLRTPEAVGGVKFCDGQFDCNDISEIPVIPGAEEVAQSVCTTLEDWLDKLPVEPSKPPLQNVNFLNEVKDTIHTSLNPAYTLVERSKNRLQLSGVLAERFAEGYQGDPLDPIMWSPEFPQPMYEPLRDISHDLLLPGVEKIPQNTLGLLETNRRFLESYMCGCNHEFAGELLWRGYPTDQRGSYFRQFWDIDEYIPQQDLLDELFLEWKAKQNNGAGIFNLDQIPREFRERMIIRDDRIELAVPALFDDQLNDLVQTILRKPLAQVAVISIADKRRLIIKNNKLKPVVQILSNTQLNELLTEIVTVEELEEWLKDIKPLIKWHDEVLGANKTKDTEMLVLVVRGDLLKRYPNAMIYAIDAVHANGFDGAQVPALPEFIKHGDSGMSVENIIGDSKREFPVFKATLPTDLTFFGFAFEKEDAISGGRGLGKMFVIEEMVTDARFGMDLPMDPISDLHTWDDLSWAHFGFGVTEADQYFGDYADNVLQDDLVPDNPAQNAPPLLSQDTSSAARAWITFQKPVRIAVHARQMIPKDELN